MMKITIDSNNHITGYVLVGDLNNSIEIDSVIVPKGFFDSFDSCKYVYTNGVITINSDYELPAGKPSQPSTSQMMLNQLIQTVAQIQAKINDLNQKIKENEDNG